MLTLYGGNISFRSTRQDLRGASFLGVIEPAPGCHTGYPLGVVPGVAPGAEPAFSRVGHAVAVGHSMTHQNERTLLAAAGSIMPKKKHRVSPEKYRPKDKPVVLFILYAFLPSFPRLTA